MNNDWSHTSTAPWRFNPSSWRQRIPICMLALAAFGIAVYMALYQWRVLGDVWDPVFGAQTKAVLDSAVSHRMWRAVGIPDAALGAIGYLSEAVFALAGSTRRWQFRPWLVALFGLDVIALGIVSVVLVILQATVVGAWCFPCVLTALLSIGLLYFAYPELRSTTMYMRRVRQISASWNVAWRVFWGGTDEVAQQVGGDMAAAKA